jgi:hypothetical protein
MRDRPLWEKIKYKYEYVGQVDKDGESYKKFRKVRRFPVTKKTLSIILFVLLIAVILAVANLLTGLFFAGSSGQIHSQN